MTDLKITALSLAIFTLIVTIAHLIYIIYNDLKYNKNNYCNQKENRKLKKKKQKQNEELKSIKDRLEYLELKQSGAKIETKHIDGLNWTQYYLKYINNEKVEEIHLGNFVAQIVKETDKYIVLIQFRIIAGSYLCILDKSNGKLCDINQLSLEKAKIEEEIQTLNSIEKENKTHNIQQSTTKPKRKVGRPKTKK